MSTTLDLMEYANDAAAQAAYVTNAGGQVSNADIDDEDMADISDWTDSNSGTGAGSQVTFDSKSCLKLDTGASDGWAGKVQDLGAFGARTVFSFNAYCDAIGVKDSAQELRITAYNGTYQFSVWLCSDGLFIYDGASWTEVGTNIVVQDTWQEWTFDVTWGATVDVYLNGVLVGNDVDCSASSASTDGQIEFTQVGYTIHDRISYIDWFKAGSDFSDYRFLQSYSESTIKEQGSYSLKGIGAITTSLNKTLTRTIGSPIDLSAQDMVSFKMRSSRTGANIKIGIHDVGGTTTEVTPTIAVADTWQTINMSLYAVASANKDAIDSIIITIVNADASNTFYIDDMLGENIAIVTTAYSVELRNKSFQFKQYLTPFVNKIQWEWNRLGGCGRCQIEITKGYRDIIFSARDDIQIRVKDGSTTKLVYRGYLANITPMLKVGQTITLDVRGYFDILKKIVVHNAGDTLSYAAKTVAFMADDIADTFIVPNTPITIAGALTAGAFEADAMDFLCTVDEALRTLAELQGDIEYGVNENLVLFWETESTTINNKFFVGNNVAVLERKVNWDSLVNKIYLIGGEVAGVKYKKTAENTDSQAEYYLVEEILNNSSITTNSVSAQYMSSILSERAQPKFSFKAQIKNTALRIEDTVPLGQVTFYDASYDNVSLGDLIGSIIGETADGGSDITIGETGDGGSDVTVGRSFSDQIDRISYKLSDTPGRFNIEVQLGDTTLETAAKIKQLELKLNSLQATG